MHVLAAFLLTLICTAVLTAQTTFETTRNIEFAGRMWEARTGFGGPGPNSFSSALSSGGYHQPILLSTERPSSTHYIDWLTRKLLLLR